MLFIIYILDFKILETDLTLKSEKLLIIKIVIIIRREKLNPKFITRNSSSPIMKSETVSKDAPSTLAIVFATVISKPELSPHKVHSEGIILTNKKQAKDSHTFVTISKEEKIAKFNISL